MFVVFLHGPPASGKHTIGALLSAALDLPLFHNHLTVDLVRVLFPFGSPGFIELRSRVWLTAFEQAAIAGRSFIFTFNPEASVDPKLVDALCAVVTRHAGRIYFIELHCAEILLEARMAAPSRAQFGKLTDAGTYRRLRDAGAFEFPALPAPLVKVCTDAARRGGCVDTGCHHERRVRAS